MALKLITPPTEEPITLAEAKLHLRVDHSDDDALISTLIVAARKQAEHITGRALINQTWELALDAFPDNEIELQKVPAASINWIRYLDESNVLQTISALSYGLDNYGLQHWVIPADGYTWPESNGGANSVKVQFVAGYGNASAVPEGIKAWIKLAVGALFAQREAVGEIQIYPLPRDFMDGLLDPYRTYAL